MRHLLISATLLGVAACAWEPVGPAAAPAPVPVAAVAAPAPVVPAPPPAPLVSFSLPVPNPVPWFLEPPGPGRLTLNNFSFDRAHVEAIVTASPTCNVRVEGDVRTSFDLPLNGTEIVTARPGADVCWRRQIEPGQQAGQSGGPPSGWSDWNRAYVAEGVSVNARL